MEDMSIRWNARLVEYLYGIRYLNTSFKYYTSFTYYDAERDYFYGIKKELRDVYLKYEPDMFESYLIDYVDKQDDFALAHVSSDRAELFIHTLEYGDWNEFKEYMGDKLETYKTYLNIASSYEELFNRPKYIIINGFIELRDRDDE